MFTWTLDTVSQVLSNGRVASVASVRVRGVQRRSFKAHPCLSVAEDDTT